jgi:RNA polymerase-binding transcription factor DksA
VNRQDKLKLVKKIRNEIEIERQNITELERLASMNSADSIHPSLADTGDGDALTGLWARVNKLQKVLAKIDDADFGSCTVCGKDIPLDRLMIVPDTSHCVRHAENSESR